MHPGADIDPGPGGLAGPDGGSRPDGAPGQRALIATGLVVGLVVIGLIRVWLSGWAPLAPDDARYLYVGLSVLDGNGAVNPSGAPYLLRSPVYGLALALGSQLVGGDPLVGARLVAVAAALLGLLGALRIGWLVAGPGAAAGTALALLATPLLWQLLPSLRIDLSQTALVIAVLLVAWRPTTRRWAAAGVILGLVVLVKETALPLVALPVALIGTVPGRAAGRMAIAYVGAAVATAAWWWVVVWAGAEQIFPANALAVIEGRDVEGALRLHASALPLLGACAIGWAGVAWRARHEFGARLLLVAGAGLAPAAIYAASQGLNARNYAGLAVLSAIAVGVTGATLVAAARGGRNRPTGALVRAGAALTLVAVLVFAVAGPVLGQRGAPPFVRDQLADDLVAWLAENTGDGERIVMAFREREEMALRRYGRTEVGVLPIARVKASEPLEDFIWMGLRDDQLFGYRRAAWARALTEPPATHLVLVGPHPFTPTDLVGARPDGPSVPGLELAATLDSGGDHAAILRVDADRLLEARDTVPLHLSADAAVAWLGLAGGSDAVERLLRARPVVSGTGVEDLLARLGDRACRIPAPSGATRLAPAGTCDE